MPSADHQEPLTAKVLNIQRMSTEDGPGLRTTVFLKGCPLRCDWCHNPESIATKPRVVWNGTGCLGCGACLEVCPTGALSDPAGDGMRLSDPGRCERCGRCVDICPSAVLEILGEDWTVPSLVAEVAKDRAYFGPDGGVTLSGGEPALQASFAADFLRAAREKGLHTVLDTCGAVSWEHLAAVVREADLVLYDLKLADPAAHERHTGQSNSRVFANLRALGALMTAEPRPKGLWIRTPLIPGATAQTDNIRALADWIGQTLDGRLLRWELCAFNNLCVNKYERLGLDWPYADRALLPAAELEELRQAAIAQGLDPDRVLVTGAAKAETNGVD